MEGRGGEGNCSGRPEGRITMNNGTNPGKLLLAPVSPGQGNFPLNETCSCTERGWLAGGQAPNFYCIWRCMGQVQNHDDN